MNTHESRPLESSKQSKSLCSSLAPSPSPPFIFAGADKGRDKARHPSRREGERRPPAMDPLIKLLDDDVVRDPNPNPSFLILEFVCFFWGKGRKDSNGGFVVGLRRTRPCTRAPTSRPSRRRSTVRWRAAAARAPAPRPPPPSLWITAPVSFPAPN